MEGVWTITDFPIAPYPIAILVSFAAGFGLVYGILRRQGHPRNIIGYSLALILVTTLYGARFYGVAVSGFQENLLTSGTSSLGGAIGVILSVILMGKIYPPVRKDLWRTFCMALPLMYGLAKTGCFLAGCCYGIPYDGPFSVAYRNRQAQTGPVFPVQLLESLVFLMIFFLGLWLYAKKSRHTASWVILLCAVSKFSLEYLRQEHIGRGITPNQWVCVAFFLLSVIALVRGKNAGVEETGAIEKAG